MRYVHTKTKVEISCDCEVKGDWKLVTQATTQTIKEIKSELDALGISYTDDLKKDELLKLLESKG